MPISPKHTKQELLTRPWEELCKERWDRGRPNYRSDETTPFVGDPIVELMEELLDALNYCREAQGQLHRSGIESGRAVIRMKRLAAIQLVLECGIVALQEGYRCDL